MSWQRKKAFVLSKCGTKKETKTKGQVKRGTKLSVWVYSNLRRNAVISIGWIGANLWIHFTRFYPSICCFCLLIFDG